MLRKFKPWINKISLAGLARIKTDEIFLVLFSSPQAEEKYPSVRILKKDGAAAIQNFRRSFSDKVNQIVHSDNPLRSIRQALIKSIQSECLGRLLLSEESQSNRQLVYDVLNEGRSDSDQLWSDEICAAVAVWTDLESISLRMLQSELFRKTRMEDWESTYSQAYEGFTKQLFHSILDNKKGQNASLNAVLMKAYRELVLQFEQDLFAKSQ
jgi:hypothetical protein